MAILVLFEQFSGKFCFHFWPLILSVSPNNDAFFFAHFRLCVLKTTQAYCYEEVRNYEKLYLTTALLNTAGGEDASPSGPAPGHHDRKCSIFLPKSSEEQKKGHYVCKRFIFRKISLGHKVHLFARARGRHAARWP